LIRGRFASRSSTNLVHAWRSLALLMTVTLPSLPNRLDRARGKLNTLLPAEQLQQDKHSLVRTQGVALVV
jgi:hypothetical protein